MKWAASNRWQGKAVRGIAALGAVLSFAAAAVPQATEAPDVTRWPVVDGTDLHFERLDAGRGLSQTRVAQMVQDDRGFLWFGTQHGLNRYDGYAFKVFVNEPGQPGSLGGVFVYALFKDRDGALWVGTDQSLDRYDAATETFTHFRLDAQRQPTVLHISQDRDGALWLATAAGLYRLDPKSGATRRFVHDEAQPDSLASSDVKSSGEDRRGGFWVATAAGLDAFSRQTGRVTLHVPLPVPVREFTFHEDREGVFWLAYGSGNGLAVLDRERGVLHRQVWREGDSAGTALTGVFSMLEDRDGTLWLATMGDGLLKLDRANGRLVRYRHRAAQPDSLAGDRAIALLQDRDGALWVGLHALPPNRVSPQPPLFDKFLPGVAVPGSLGENLVNTVFQDAQGPLWLGAGGALQQVDRRSGAVQLHHPAGRGRSVEILSIVDAGAGRLWLGTLGNGLIRYTPRSGAAQVFLHDRADPASPSSDIVTRLLTDRQGRLWATTWNGLNRLDPATGRVLALHKRRPGDSAEAYFELAEDHDGRLWLGSTEGLYRFDPATGGFETFRHDPARADTLSNDTLNAVLVDAAGTLWVATQNGLNRRDAATGRFRHYFKRDGLPGNAVSCLLEDARHDLWISTNAGLARFDPRAGTFRNYSVADGLPGADLTAWGACFKGPGGTMVFGGFAGAVAFEPDRITDPPGAPPLVLTELRLSGRPVAPGSAGSPLQRSIALAGPLTLTDSQNTFSIDTAVLSFASPATHRYRHRLDGLDDAWQEGGAEARVASYTALPPGHYVLRLQGATSHGAWSEPGIALPITVLPPWWQRWWFRAVYVLAVLVLLAGLYLARMRHIARQFELRLEERLSERMRIARDLHDSLLQSFQGLMFHLQAVLHALPGRPAEATARLEDALQRGDAAIGEARDAVLDLRSTAGVQDEVADALQATWADLVQALPEAAGVPFAVVVNGKPRRLDLAIRDEVCRISREALRNTVQHAQARHVEAEIGFGREAFTLRIRDDGVGLTDQVVAQGARPGHWGLPGMRERAERLGGTLAVWSRPGAGTEVALSLPAAVAYPGAPA